jgi:hypothetical protein
MSLEIPFAFIGEGASDTALVVPVLAQDFGGKTPRVLETPGVWWELPRLSEKILFPSESYLPNVA